MLELFETLGMNTDSDFCKTYLQKEKQLIIDTKVQSGIEYLNVHSEKGILMLVDQAEKSFLKTYTSNAPIE